MKINGMILTPSEEYDLKRICSGIVGYKHELEQSFINNKKIRPSAYMYSLFPFIKEQIISTKSEYFNPEFIVSGSWRNYNYKKEEVNSNINKIEKTNSYILGLNLIGKFENEVPLCFQSEGKNRIELYYQEKKKIKYDARQIQYEIFYENIGILKLKLNLFEYYFSYVIKENGDIIFFNILLFPEKTIAFLKAIKFNIIEFLTFDISEEENIKNFLNRIDVNHQEAVEIRKKILSYYNNKEIKVLKKKINIKFLIEYWRSEELIVECENNSVKDAFFYELEQYKKKKFDELLENTMKG